MVMRFQKWLESEEPQVKPGDEFRPQIDLPMVRQSHNYDCGAAALRSIAQFFGVGPDKEDRFIELCKTTKTEGTHPDDIMRVARAFGLKVEAYEHLSLQDLFKYITKGIPVICAIQAWGDEEDYPKMKDGHYVVAIGFDDQFVYFEDPSILKTRGHLTHKKFMNRWYDVDRYDRALYQFGIAIWGKKPEETRATSKSQMIQ